MGIAGYVLIGGESQRLGVDKASMLVSGIPAADRLARLLGEVCQRGVHLVGREMCPWSAYPTLHDVQGGVGPLAGVLTALEHAGQGSALIIATDLWGLTRSTVDKLLGVGRPEPASGPAVDVVFAAPSSGSGRDQPLCALWRVETCLPVVRATLASGRRSMFSALSDLRATGRVTTPVAVDEGELVNINRPEDVERFLSMRSGEEQTPQR